jgi:hypothetical protein
VYFLNGIPIKNVKNWDRQKFGQKFGNLVVVGGDRTVARQKNFKKPFNFLSIFLV